MNILLVLFNSSKVMLHYIYKLYIQLFPLLFPLPCREMEKLEQERKLQELAEMKEKVRNMDVFILFILKKLWHIGA